MPAFRILIVTFTFPPNKDGVSENARAMAENFAAHGHAVTVVTGYASERTSDCYGDNIRVKQFRVGGSPNLREGIRGEVKEFKDFVAAFDGDFVIVHCWHVWSSALAEAVFPRLGAAKKIMMSHGFAAQRWIPQRRFPWGIGCWLGWQPWLWTFPWRLRQYDHLVVTSARADCDRFLDHSIAKATFYPQVTVIPNGTDPQRFDSANADFRNTWGLNNKFMLLNVANYSERKNQELAVRAFARADLANAVLVLIGSEFNSYYERVTRIADDLHLGRDRILFLEKIDRASTYSAFKACDAVVLSATAETQPIVLLEAMACAKPFVSTDTGCVRDFPGGYVVRTEQEMAQCFQTLGQDSNLRQTLGAEGRVACLATYTWQKVGARWEELLRRLADRENGNSGADNGRRL